MLIGVRRPRKWLGIFIVLIQVVTTSIPFLPWPWRNQLDERPLAAACGSENGGMLAGGTGEGHTVESNTLVAAEGHVAEFNQRGQVSYCRPETRRRRVSGLQTSNSTLMKPASSAVSGSGTIQVEPELPSVNCTLSGSPLKLPKL